MSCTLLFLALLPLIDDINTNKALCPCSKLFFSKKTVGKVQDLINNSYTACKGGIRYKLKSSGAPDTTEPLVCSSSSFQTLIELDWGLRCFEEPSCVDLVVGSAKFVAVLLSLHLGYATIALIIVLISLFGYGNGEGDKQILQLKSKFSAFIAIIGGFWGYREGYFLELMGNPARKMRNASGRFKKKI